MPQVPELSLQKGLRDGRLGLTALRKLSTKSTPSLKTPQNGRSASIGSTCGDNSSPVPTVPTPSFNNPWPFLLPPSRRRRASTSSYIIKAPSGQVQRVPGFARSHIESEWDSLVENGDVRKIHLSPEVVSSESLLCGADMPCAVLEDPAPRKLEAPQIPPIDPLPPIGPIITSTSYPSSPESGCRPRPNDIDTIIKTHRPSPPVFFIPDPLDAPDIPANMEKLTPLELEHQIKQLGYYVRHELALAQRSQDHPLCSELVKHIQRKIEPFIAAIEDMQNDLQIVHGRAPIGMESSSAEEITVAQTSSASSDGEDSTVNLLRKISNLGRSRRPSGAFKCSSKLAMENKPRELSISRC